MHGLRLQQTRLPEAEGRHVADDDVVADPDAQRFRRGGDPARHRDIGAARPRIAGGRVVAEDDAEGSRAERGRENLARIDRDMVDRALLETAAADQAPAPVEKEHVKLFPPLA